MARSASRRRRSASSGDDAAPPAEPRLLLDEQGAIYRVLLSEPAAGAPRRERLVLTVDVIGAGPLGWAREFGLTSRETRVAELLARRCTNAEIAEDVGISRHTARHHTERVLGKLGVTSRAAVRRKLLDAALQHGPPRVR